MASFREFGEAFFSLFYPSLCAACAADLRRGEQVLCLRCILYLPQTDHFQRIENPVRLLFAGKVGIRSAAALFYFSKGEKVQQLAHLLKYGGRMDVGEFTGRMIGEQVVRSSSMQDVQAVVPVPLHLDRLRKRGYNQAACISAGISEASGILHLPDALIRLRASDTQTRKQRFDRYQNVDSIFQVRDPATVAGKHILLVDDVITTGSTLIAAVEALREVPKVEVSVVAMAAAR